MKVVVTRKIPGPAVDLVVLVLFPLFAVIASFFLQANLIVSTVLFYGLPALYFSLRHPQGIKRAMVFSLTVSIPFFIAVDYIVATDYGWFVPTVAPFRLFGVAPLEDFIWIVIVTYDVLIYYQNFVDKGVHRAVGKHLKELILLLAILLGGFLVMFFGKSELLRVPYAYFLVLAPLTLIPLFLFLGNYEAFLGKFVKTGVYFFFVNLLAEITALKLEQWSFPGTHFVGWMALLGVRFPLEEFFFFILLSVVALLCWFEYFDDDKHLVRR